MIICQAFYAQVLVKELVLENSDASNTYSRAFQYNTNIFQSKQTILEKKLTLKVLLITEDFHLRTGFQHLINTLLGQDLSSLQVFRKFGATA